MQLKCYSMKRWGTQEMFHKTKPEISESLEIEFVRSWVYSDFLPLLRGWGKGWVSISLYLCVSGPALVDDIG